MSGLTREILVERLVKLQEGHRTASRSVEQLFGAISQCELFIKMLDEQDTKDDNIIELFPPEENDDA